jgi:hypothetical protein
MAEAEVIQEADVVPEPTQALARVEPARLAVTPQVATAELGERLTAIREVMKNEMVEGVDYGAIPGTGDKPTLLKPGAEKLGVLFQLDVQLVNEKVWAADHLTVVSKGTCFHAPTGTRVGYGEGICTTRERKYAYRQQSRQCPHCHAEAIIKGKDEYGGGWVCFKKKGGCGAKFNDGDTVIEGQTVGEIDNPDLPDLWNTVDKMAEKRARVDVVLAVTGASAIFTQDLEDGAPPETTSAPALPPFGEPASDGLRAQTHNAISYLLGCGPTDRAVIASVARMTVTLEKVGFGASKFYFPFASAAAICAVATELKEQREGTGETAEERAERIIAEEAQAA